MSKPWNVISAAVDYHDGVARGYLAGVAESTSYAAGLWANITAGKELGSVDQLSQPVELQVEAVRRLLEEQPPTAEPQKDSRPDLLKLLPMVEGQLAEEGCRQTPVRKGNPNRARRPDRRGVSEAAVSISQIGSR